MTLDMRENALKKLVNNSRTGSQRMQLVPTMTVDPGVVPVGTMWGRQDEGKVYFQMDADTVIDLTAAGTGDGGDLPVDIEGERIILRSLPRDRIALNSITGEELADGSVDGSSWANIIEAISRVTITSPNAAVPALTLDTPFEQIGDIFRVLLDGQQRVRVGPTDFAIGADLPDAIVTMQTTSSDVLLRLRGQGGMILAENELAQPLFSVNGNGDLFMSGTLTSSGNIQNTGGMTVGGVLTVSDQANFLAGVSVGTRLDVADVSDFDGVATFNVAPHIPAGYSMRVGSAAWLKTSGGSPNRIILEGVADTSTAQLQLGTGGPVLTGALSDPTALYVGSNKVVTSAVGGLLGSQLAFDTITGGATSGVGNIASQTVQAYNIKDGTITGPKLSNGAIGTLQIASGAVTDAQILAMAATKLLSGTLDADEIFMGPSGTIYLGPVDHAHITDERVQIDAVGIRAYNSANDVLAQFLPGSFVLRSAVSGARLELTAATGLTLYDLTGTQAVHFDPLGTFSLNSSVDGARTVMDSQDGLRFIAAPARNLAYNPGFRTSSQHENGVAAEILDDQRHVFAGEWSVRLRCTDTNPAHPSYCDVPFKNTVGTGSTVTRTRVNACTNPSLATVITGWSANDTGAGVGTRAAADGFLRPNVLRLSVLTTGAVTVLGPVITSITTGQQWTTQCNIRASVAQNVTPIIQWINASDVVILETPLIAPVALKAGIVTQIGVTGTAPAAVAKLRIKLSLSSVMTDLIEVSNAVYERAGGLDEYADGDRSGYQWDGTPGNSTSSLIPVAVPDSASNLLSIFVWSDYEAYCQIEGRDSTAGVGRGTSIATRLVANQWSRVSVVCTGVMDKVRLHFPSSDLARQVRLITPIWYSAVQVERDRTTPTPFCSGDEPGCYWEAVPYSSASIRLQDTVTAELSPSLGMTVSGAIVGGSITASSFFAGLISASEIHGTKIIGGVLTGNQITGDQITAGSLNTDKFAARSVTAAIIDVGTITATNMAADSITATQIAANAVTAAKVAARAITADKIETDLLLSSRIVAGVALTGARTELNATSGLQCFNSSGTRTVWLDSSTGNALITGTYQSALTGERVNILPDGTFRLYPASGSNYSVMNNLGSTGVSWRGPVDGNNRSGRLDVSTSAAAMTFADEAHLDSGGLYGLIQVFKDHLTITSPQTTFAIDGMSTHTPQSGSRILNFCQNDSSNASIADSFMSYRRRSSGGGVFIASIPQSAGFALVGSQVFARNGSDNANIGMVASAFTVSSSRAIKRNIRDIDWAGKKALDLVRGVEPKEYQYADDLDAVVVPRPAKVPGILGERPRVDAQGNPVYEVTGTDAEGNPIHGRQLIDTFELDWPNPQPTEAPLRYGPMAEDIMAIAPGVVDLDANGDPVLAAHDVAGIVWKALGELADWKARVTETRVLSPALSVAASPVILDVTWDNPLLWDPTDVSVCREGFTVAQSQRISTVALPIQLTRTGCKLRITSTGAAIAAGAGLFHVTAYGWR